MLVVYVSSILYSVHLYVACVSSISYILLVILYVYCHVCESV